MSRVVLQNHEAQRRFGQPRSAAAYNKELSSMTQEARTDRWNWLMSIYKVRQVNQALGTVCYWGGSPCLSAFTPRQTMHCRARSRRNLGSMSMLCSGLYVTVYPAHRALQGWTVRYFGIVEPAGHTYTCSHSVSCSSYMHSNVVACQACQVMIHSMCMVKQYRHQHSHEEAEFA